MVGETGADGIQVDVAEGCFPVRGVQHAGVEASLPEVAGGAADGIAVGGVLAVEVHHEERDGVGAVTDGDLVVVIGHHDVASDADFAFFAEGAEEVEEVLAVGGGGKDGLAIVAALGEM